MNLKKIINLINKNAKITTANIIIDKFSLDSYLAFFNIHYPSKNYILQIDNYFATVKLDNNIKTIIEENCDYYLLWIFPNYFIYYDIMDYTNEKFIGPDLYVSDYKSINNYNNETLTQGLNNIFQLNQSIKDYILAYDILI